MELQHLYGPSTLTSTLLVLFCMTWPWVAFTFLHRRERSSSPVTGMLIPIAVALCGTWVDIAGALESRYATARMTVEALMLIALGVLCALCVAVVALIKRHRPVLDRGAAVLTALLLADVAAALTVPHTIALSLAAAAMTGLLAIAMLTWLILVVTRWTPKPHGP